MEPLISIIVPIYNVEEYIHKCVDSILAQTHKNLEIILVDDGSPDNCPAICDEYAQQDSRIRVIHKPNGGLSDARNAGLDVAQGDYIGFVDSDDWIAPDMYEYLLNGMIKYDTDISSCQAIYVYEWRLQYKNIGCDTVYTREEMLEEVFNDRMENYAWSRLYKAKIWKDVRFPVGKNFEDILTFYKAVEAADRIVDLQEGKYFYLIRKGGISGTRDFKNRLHIYSAIVDRYEDVAPRMPQFRDALFFRVMQWYVHELSREIVNKPEKRAKNKKLLAILAPFVARHKDEINAPKWQRKKMDAFALGTVDGCKKVLKYHDRHNRIEQHKQSLKKLLNIEQEG